MKLDATPAPTVASRSMMQKYRGRLILQGCDRNVCQYQYLFTNSLIAKLHIARRAEIKLYVNLFAGSLSAVNITYTSAVFRENSPIVWVQEDFCGDRSDITCDHFGIDPHGRDVGKTWNGSVEFGQKATPTQKHAAWAVNLNCLTALRGCKDISQLLPTVWKLTGPGVVSSRMRSTADSITDASQPLPE